MGGERGKGTLKQILEFLKAVNIANKEASYMPDEELIQKIEELKKKLHETKDLSEKTNITSQIIQLYSKLKIVN